MPDTERMVLRRTNWPDVDNIVALNADVEVMQHLGSGLPMKPAAVLAQEMPRMMAHNNRTDQLGYWVAREKETNTFLGWFMVTPVAGEPTTAQVGYRLRSGTHDAGYDVEGVLNMLDIARSANISTVVATATEADHGSQEALEKAGLHRVDALPESVDLIPVDDEQSQITYLLTF